MILTLLACGPGTTGPLDSTTTPTETSTPTGSVSIGTTATTGATGHTGGGDVFDCADVPDQAGAAVNLTGPRGYNDVVFDADGVMVGSDGNGLVRSTAPDDATVWLPGVGLIYKMGVLPDGDIVAARSAGEVGSRGSRPRAGRACSPPASCPTASPSTVTG